MASLPAEDDFQPFAILTSRLILLPTPMAVSIFSYRTLYAELHSDAAFCEMGFGKQFPVKSWSDDETREVIETRDIARSWKRLGLGDFAVALRSSGLSDDLDHGNFRLKQSSSVAVVKGAEFEHLAGPNRERLDDMKWIGYAGVRDATITSLPPQEPGDRPFPPWYEMIELRYGISPRFWGNGFAQEASEAVMQWSISERGVKRFIAETEKENQRSARVLLKLGFKLSDTNYWKEPGEVEWERIAR